MTSGRGTLANQREVKRTNRTCADRERRAATERDIFEQVLLDVTKTYIMGIEGQNKHNKVFFDKEAERHYSERIRQLHEAVQSVVEQCTQAVEQSKLPDEHKRIISEDLQKMQRAYLAEQNWDVSPKGLSEIEDSSARRKRLGAAWGEGGY
jgi:hypothetical protein